MQPDWMRKRDVQALDLSPGFIDFGRLPWCMPEVGLVAWRKDLRGGSKDLMQRRMKAGHVMIEVRLAGYIDGLCSDNTFDIKRC